MSAKLSKSISVTTAIASIPLILSFNIKYQWFPRAGYAYLFFAGLLSVLVVPLLLVIGLVIAVANLRSTNQWRRANLRWNLIGVLIAVVAEIIFLAARYSPP
jgi:Na+/H+-dicarboxylate symporter